MKKTILLLAHLLPRRAWLWTGFLAFAMIAFGPQPAQAAMTEAWVQRYGSEAGSLDRASKIVTDAAGNVIVAGATGTQSDSVTDMLIIKYSGAGVPLWTNRYNGLASVAIAVAVSASGNVFVTGSSATIAYSGAGVPLWTNGSSGAAIALDGSGNVFVTGGDFTTIAYSGAGLPLWTNRYDGPGPYEDVAIAIAVDGSGNVFVTGSSYLGGGDSSYATVAYSGAGVPLWTNCYNGSPPNIDDRASAVAVDASGNVFVTGSSATIAYSGAGAPLWTNNVSGTAIALDGSGNVFVTGSGTIAYSGAGVPLCTNRYGGSDLAIGSDGAVYVTGTSDDDFATVKYVWQTEIAIQLLSTIPPQVNLTLSGAPNSSWAIERAPELTGPWTNLSALLIGTNGSAQFQDTHSPYPAGFYRARQ